MTSDVLSEAWDKCRRPSDMQLSGTYQGFEAKRTASQERKASLLHQQTCRKKNRIKLYESIKTENRDETDNEVVSYRSVTMMAEGWAHAVMSVTIKRKMRKGMSVLQVRSHFPDVA